MSRIDDLAESLLSKFHEQVPQSATRYGGVKVSPSMGKVEEGLDRFYAAAADLRKANRLWFIGWARVLFKFQRKLLDTGYPSDLASKILMSLLLSSRKSG